MGTSATKNTGEGDDDVLAPGSFGVGSKNLPVISDIWDKSQGTRFCNITPATSGGPGVYGSGIRLSDRNFGNGSSPVAQQSFAALVFSGKIIQFMSMADGNDSGWMQIYHTGNTTRASDGKGTVNGVDALRLRYFRHDFDIAGQLTFGDHFGCRAIIRTNQNAVLTPGERVKLFACVSGAHPL